MELLDDYSGPFEPEFHLTRLSRRGERWIYGIKVLTPAGRRVEVSVDAGTLALIPARR